uniref:Bestrophin homolog n=1 Tax=Ditylenchus dipsaci TaxID=166011 RepID=A0A915E4L4_9BILA
MLISALMKSNGPASREKKRQIRLAVCGYWNLAFVLLMRDISVSTKKRFPSLDNLNPVLATKEEIQLLRKAADMLDGEDGGAYFQQSCLYSLPLDWIQKIIKHAADEGNFFNYHLNALHEEVVRTRQKIKRRLRGQFHA